MGSGRPLVTDLTLSRQHYYGEREEERRENGFCTGLDAAWKPGVKVKDKVCTAISAVARASEDVGGGGGGALHQQVRERAGSDHTIRSGTCTNTERADDSMRNFYLGAESDGPFRFFL